ncbi:mechanosensitive ion channel family protein [Paenibacillus allorhizosphaerae]|uniref:Small-conductance mechanosensitive channel n=1 Tax=Paenibacillus allorhizosphaerae TaxID=2849866 RepID=A0ABM8VQG5_9BACL|nr:mechanosensitive ion channel family protein [Paenibacillus allorhizosphaerae]CAG7654129.1 Small-conductance mechanosensitive channel [Paenibacillus allorhizosphaerae]
MDQIMQKLQAEGNSTREWSGIWNEVKTKTVSYVTDPEIWTGLLLAIIKIIIIYIAARIITKIANKALQHMMIEREKSPLKFDTRRTKTIAKLVGNIVTYVVNFIMILMILNQFGVSLAPVLAGAGVVGLAVGFGAQSLVKDVITGFFIIFEDQFAVGDVIQIGTYRGTVEEIGLRVTRIKSWTGEEYIIPNGTITQVTNYSIHNSLAVVDVMVSHESDIDEAMRILEQTVKKHYEKDTNMVKEPELLGVQMLGASEVTLRVTVECKPVTQHAVARQLNAEIKKAFREHGLEMPYPRLVTYHKTERAE